MSPSTSSPPLRSPQDPLSMGKKGKGSVAAAGSTGLASPAPAMPPESAVLGEDGERTRHRAARIRPGRRRAHAPASAAARERMWRVGESEGREVLRERERKRGVEGG